MLSLSAEGVKRVSRIAIPCDDLDTAREFYVNGVGCRFARAMEDRITLDFFSAQVVCLDFFRQPFKHFEGRDLE